MKNYYLFENAVNLHRVKMIKYWLLERLNQQPLYKIVLPPFTNQRRVDEYRRWISTLLWIFSSALPASSSPPSQSLPWLVSSHSMLSMQKQLKMVRAAFFCILYIVMEIFRQSPVECDSSLCLHSSAFSYETTAIERKITGFTQQPLIPISVVLLGNWSRSPRKKPLCGDDELLPDLPYQVLVHKPTLAMAAGCWHKVVDKTMPGYQVSNLRIILAAKTRKKNSFSTLSLCPFLGEHLSHLANVHLPVVLLVHHHLNDNHHLPNGPITYIVANMITAPTCNFCKTLPTPLVTS